MTLCAYSYFSGRQKRMLPCDVPVDPPNLYCPAHSGEERMSCPYNPCHNVQKKKYTRHCRICPNRPDQNAKKLDGSENVSHRQTNAQKEPLAKRYSPEQFQILFCQVPKLYSALIHHEPELQELVHPCTSTLYADTGEKKRKNILQESSIIAHMNRSGILRQWAVYVELGAGSGGLSRHIQVALNGSSHHVLVDMAQIRSLSRVDRYIRQYAKPGARTVRLKKDIRHVTITDLFPEEFNESSTNEIVFVSKHFCGDATDIALQFMGDHLSQLKERGIRVSVCIATCCHAKCSYQICANRPWIANILQMDETQYEMMCSLAAWRTLSETRTEEEELVHGLNRDERRILGRQCAALIDAGRAEYLQRRGFTTELVEYTSRTVETTLLIGFEPKS